MTYIDYAPACKDTNNFLIYNNSHFFARCYAVAFGGHLWALCAMLLKVHFDPRPNFLCEMFGSSLNFSYFCVVYASGFAARLPFMCARACAMYYGSGRCTRAYACDERYDNKQHKQIIFNFNFLQL